MCPPPLANSKRPRIWYEKMIEQRELFAVIYAYSSAPGVAQSPRRPGLARKINSRPGAIENANFNARLAARVYFLLLSFARAKI